MEELCSECGVSASFMHASITIVGPEVGLYIHGTVNHAPRKFVRIYCGVHVVELIGGNKSLSRDPQDI